MLRRKILFIGFPIAILLTHLILSSRVILQSNLRRLTTTDERALNLNPTISDDGSVVAFESTIDLADVGGPSSFHGLFAKNPATETHFSEIGRTRLVSPSLSANGAFIVFASVEDLIGENEDRNSEIYLFHESELKQITHTYADTAETRLADGNFQPEISGDGRLITFTSNRDVSGLNVSGKSAIFLLDVTTATFTEIATTETAEFTSPKLSGDGSRVVFLQKSLLNNQTDMLAYEISSATTKILLSNLASPSIATTRAISNNGHRIVYSAETGPNQTQVFVFDQDESGPRQITSLGSRTQDVALNASISGDGKRVSFATRRRVIGQSDGSVELYVIDLPTREFHQITNAPSSATAEVVSSMNFDGSLVVFNFARILSGPTTDGDFANNSEIYISGVPLRPASGSAEAFNGAFSDFAGSLPTSLAPESIVNVKGSAFAWTNRHASLSVSGEFPNELAGLTASINGLPAQIVFVSPNEITIVLPRGVTNGPNEIVVTNRDGFQSKAPVVIANASPGLFSFEGASHRAGAIVDSDKLLPAPFDPTSRSLRLTVFATGARHAGTVTARLNAEAVNVDTVRPSNIPGLDEIHLLLPESFRGAGMGQLSVVADGVESNRVTLDISGSPIRDLIINEFLADPPDGVNGDANHDGVRSASADEFVELVNTTTHDIDPENYLLFTRNSDGVEVERHQFKAGTIIAAGTSAIVFGGGSPDPVNPLFRGAAVFKSSSGSLSLSNSGGGIILRDAAGVAISSVTYGTDVGLAADNNQSLTRSPDLSGRFSQFQAALGNDSQSFSPGTHVDGTPFTASPAVSSIIVSGSSHSLQVGDDLRLEAKAFDAKNELLTGVIFKWQTNPSTIVSIDADGLIKALRTGTVEVVATGRGMSSAPFQIMVAQPIPTPTPTPQPSPSLTPSPTSTPTPTVSPSPSPSVSPSPTPTPQPSSAAVVISEFRTRGPSGASDEFVELYNRSDLAIDVSGWKIKGSNASGTIGIRLVLNAGTIIPARSHFLVTNASGYSGAVLGDQTYSSGLVNDGGVALTLANDTIIDQVGLSPGSAFLEGMHLAPLPSDANQSYERRPGGLNGSSIDTDNNFNDFQIITPSDPQNLSSTPTPGPTPTPSVSPTPSPSPPPSSSASPTPLPTVSPSPTPSLQSTVLISQIFGGGGNSGAPFRNDFIELFNAGATLVDLTGYSVQYASATASTWAVTNLTALSLAPGQHYLIQQSSGGTNGNQLPTPDVVGTISLAATAGKVALVRNTTALTGNCPTDLNIVDLVGYGTTANCFRGSAPAPAPSNSTAVLRGSNGCANSQNNASDFAVGPPTPRNTTTPATPCPRPSATRLSISSPFSMVPVYEIQVSNQKRCPSFANRKPETAWSTITKFEPVVAYLAMPP